MFTIRIGRRLISEHDGQEGHSSQRFNSKTQAEFGGGQNSGAQINSEIPMKTPAIVNEPIRQALGVGDGCTLSVVRDMPSRSPVSMMITISMGLRIACP